MTCEMAFLFLSFLTWRGRKEEKNGACVFPLSLPFTPPIVRAEEEERKKERQESGGSIRRLAQRNGEREGRDGRRGRKKREAFCLLVILYRDYSSVLRQGYDSSL